MPVWYVLAGRTPVRSDMDGWTRWLMENENQVKYSEQGDVCVSTVFLGLDHNFFRLGPPLLFETVVFIAGEGRDMTRYATWDEAVAGHDATVREVFRMEVVTNG